MNAQVRPEPAARFVPLERKRIDDVMRLERQVYPFPWTAGNFADALRSGYSAWTLVADDDTLIAYAVAMLAVDEAHLLNLAVDPRRQRQGHGWQLLDWMARTMHEYGAQSLLLEVRPSNTGAQQLYRRYGFVQIGTRRGYYPAAPGREDAIVMRVDLRAAGGRQTGVSVA